MDKKTEKIFVQLFKEAVRKYFNFELTKPLTENESKLLCVEIEERTGLILGYKTLKNYSIFICGEKKTNNINPSLATLDTLSRYVLKAPATTESARMKSEDHFPYWSLYQKRKKNIPTYSGRVLFTILWIVGPAILVFILYSYLSPPPEIAFRDDFSMSDTKSLLSKSWRLISQDPIYWKRSDEEKGYLKLFTLESDNWPDATQQPDIKNLLIRPLEVSCFSAEVHIEDFFPKQKWQQAGIILMNDTSVSANTLRVSIAYNDFFGGYDSPPEIIVQGITTSASNNPEEFLHHQLFQLVENSQEIVKENLSFCRLRIEKNSAGFRFLIAVSSLPNAPYKEIGRYKSSMNPKYVGIFALKGKVSESRVVPVKFDSFELRDHPCE